MSNTSTKEIYELLVSIGELTVGNDFLKIVNYPFEPSIAYRQTTFSANTIDDIDIRSYPPTIRIGDELIFLSREKKPELEKFAADNNVKIVERPNIWGAILEPFLDTELTPEDDRRFLHFLESFGLTASEVNSLRAEVGSQMLKYNFDTMLWEWVGFDASDVLRAMRTKYNKDKFRDFYKRVMGIALLTKKIDT